MAAVFTAFLAGLVFGLGLIISGMADPAKVLGFLDLAGAWDPSLAFVMMGAVTVAALGFGLARARTTSILGTAMQWPAAHSIDRRLMGGSALYCPRQDIVVLWRPAPGRYPMVIVRHRRR